MKRITTTLLLFAALFVGNFVQAAPSPNYPPCEHTWGEPKEEPTECTIALEGPETTPVGFSINKEGTITVTESGTAGKLETVQYCTKCNEKKSLGTEDHVVTYKWEAKVGKFTASGDGLSATFTPDELGDGTCTFTPTCDHDCSISPIDVAFKVSSCKTYSGEKTFGPFSAKLPGTIAGVLNDDGDCVYTTPADITFTIPFQKEDKNYALEGTSVTWTETIDGQFKSAGIEWKSEKSLGMLGKVEVTATEFKVSINTEQQVQGELKLHVDLKEPVPLAGIAVLQKDLNGDIIFRWNNDAGEFDFSGLKNLKITLEKNQKKIASMSAKSIEKDGWVKDAVFKAENKVEFKAGGHTAKLNNLTLKFDFNFVTFDIKFKGGVGELQVKQPKNTKGDLKLKLEFDEEKVTATLSSKKVVALGCDISGKITGKFTYEFDLLELEGKDLSLAHKKLDQEIKGVSFLINKDSELEMIEFKKIELKYQKLKFSVSNGSYKKAGNEIQISADFKVKDLSMSVKNFKINGEGTVSIESIAANVQTKMVSFKGDATYKDKEFRLNAEAKFASKYGVKVKVIFGATATFNYGFAELVVSANIPIPNSGLSISSLGGAAGFNVKVDKSGKVTKTPGSFVIGFTLGISDSAGLAELKGGVVMNLGQSVSFIIKGEVSVPAKGDKYFNGTLVVEYTVGDDHVSGDLSSKIQVPAGDGWILNMNSGKLEYEIARSRWSVESKQAAKGELLEEVPFEATFRASSGIASSGISGRLTGSFDWEKRKRFTYPENFNPATPEDADATDNAAGFGIQGDLAIKVKGSLSVGINQNKMTGYLSGKVTGTNNMKVKWPNWGWIFGSKPKVHSYNVTVSGTVKITESGDFLRVQGDVYFSYQDEKEKAELDWYI